MRFVWLLVFSAALASAKEPPTPVETLIPRLLENNAGLQDVAFSEVIRATSGKRVIPFDRADADDARILAGIGAAMDAVLSAMNAPGGPLAKVTRINEASSYFEDAMQAALDAREEFECAVPRTAAGHAQRSGYPDLRLVDKATGRVVYIDPKLYARGSRTSTLRTFYFEPKKETNKVLDDARHLIVGIEHDKGAAGAWQFLRWELVDLSAFRVRLKAEFQASNRDLYRDEAVVGRSED